MGVPVDDSTSNYYLGVDDESVNGESTGANVPFYRLDLDFEDASYWNNGTVVTSTELYMLSVIATYSNMDGLNGLWSTPQYGFSRGMKEFGQVGYAAAISKLSNNLIDMNAVDMLDKKQITSDVYINALSYLRFLKGNMTSDVKARVCADGRLQREFTSRKNQIRQLHHYMHYSYHAPWMLWKENRL